MNPGKENHKPQEEHKAQLSYNFIETLPIQSKKNSLQPNPIPFRLSPFQSVQPSILEVESEDFCESSQESSVIEASQDLEEVTQHEEKGLTPQITITILGRGNLNQDSEIKRNIGFPSKSSIESHSEHSAFGRRESITEQFLDNMGRIFSPQESNPDTIERPKTTMAATSPEKRPQQDNLTLGMSLSPNEKQLKTKVTKKKTLTWLDHEETTPAAQDTNQSEKDKKTGAVSQNDHQEPNQAILTKNKKNSSKTSIVLSEEQFLTDRTIQGVSRSILQSRKVVYDQGSSNLVFRVKSSDKKTPQLACEIIEIVSELSQRRETAIFNWIHQHRHPNLIRAYSLSKSFSSRTNQASLELTVDFYPMNLMQYVAQLDLPQPKARIERKIILFQVIKGLHYLHLHQVYHRDICPTSVLVNSKLEVVITHFSAAQGSAIPQSSDYTCSRLARPPEAILNPQRSSNGPGDIWSLGCLIVYLLTGRMPFDETSDSDIILEINKVAGRPTAEELTAIGFKRKKQFIFPSMPRFSIKKLFQCEQQDLRDILKSIFVFSPAKRPTTFELLSHPYFEQMRNQKRYYELSNDYNMTRLFDFSASLSEQQKQWVIPSWYK